MRNPGSALHSLVSIAITIAAVAVMVTSATGATTKWIEAGLEGTPTELACTSASYCVVGLDESGNSDVSVYNGVHWSTAEQLFKYEGDIEALGCLSEKHCVAISGTGEVRVLSDTRWSKTTTVDALAGYPYPGGAYAMSCNTGGCVLVDALGHALMFDGSTWSRAKTVDALDPLTALSCPRPGWCMAADGSGRVLEMRNDVWTQPVGVDSAGISDLSCTSTSSCIAVDLMGRWLAFDGYRWSKPASYFGIDDVPLSLACAAPDHCIAAGGVFGVWRYEDGEWSADKGAAASLGYFGTGAAPEVDCGSRTCAVVVGSTATTDGNPFAQIR